MRAIRSVPRAPLAVAVMSVGACHHEYSAPAAAPETCPLSAAQVALAERIAETQLASGAWGFQQIWYEQIDYSFAGYQNVTGITALGLLDAYELDLADGVAECTWFAPATLARAKDYLIQWMEDYVNQTPNRSIEEPGRQSGIPTSVSAQNFLFCKHYEAVFGLTPFEQSMLSDAFTVLLARHDATYGSDPTVVADGTFNRTVDIRTNQNIPSVIGWDQAYLLRTLVAMGSPQAEIDWVQNALKGLPYFDVNLPFGIDSVTNTLVVLNGLGDTSMNATLVPAMQSKRNTDGSYANSPAYAYQSTAYALMALKALGLSADAQVTQTWLLGRVGLNGIVFDPATNLETHQVSGEILWATVVPTFP